MCWLKRRQAPPWRRASQELVKSNATGLSLDELFVMLMQPVAKGGELPKQAVANLARCAAAFCVNTTQDAPRHGHHAGRRRIVGGPVGREPAAGAHLPRRGWQAG
jgi:hypothetical protein